MDNIQMEKQLPRQDPRKSPKVQGQTEKPTDLKSHLSKMSQPELRAKLYEWERMFWEKAKEREAQKRTQLANQYMKRYEQSCQAAGEYTVAMGEAQDRITDLYAIQRREEMEKQVTQKSQQKSLNMQGQAKKPADLKSLLSKMSEPDLTAKIYEWEMILNLVDEQSKKYWKSANDYQAEGSTQLAEYLKGQSIEQENRAQRYRVAIMMAKDRMDELQLEYTEREREEKERLRNRDEQ